MQKQQKNKKKIELKKINKSTNFQKFQNVKNAQFRYIPFFYQQRKLKHKYAKRNYSKFRYFLSKFYNRIYIIVKPNNIFFGVQNTTIPDSTKFFPAFLLDKQLKITKKKIRANLIRLVYKFLYFIQKKNYVNLAKFSILTVVVPKKLKKKLLVSLAQKKRFKHLFGKRRLIMEVKSIKTFNGCTPKKQRRKKRKGLRILK